jgi:hypothetical protein
MLSRCLRPSVWLYSTVAVVVLSSMWIGRSILRRAEADEPSLPKGEIFKYDVGLPSDPWIPIAFSNLSRQRTTDLFTADPIRGRLPSTVTIHRFVGIANFNSSYFLPDS